MAAEDYHKTSQNENEALLKITDQAHFIKSIADTVPGIIGISCHPSGEIIFNNRDAFEMLGYDAAEILAMGYRERLSLVAPEHQQELKAYYARFDSLRDNEENKVEYCIKNKKGNLVWLDVRGRVFRRDEDGRVIQVLQIAHDITERKKAAQEILQLKEEVAQLANDKYRAIIDSIDEGFCLIEIILNEAGKPLDLMYLETNRIFQQQTGLGDVVGRRLREILPGIEQVWIDFYGNVALTGEPARMEYYVEAVGRWFSAYASRVGVQNNLQVAVVFDDITERKLREHRQDYLLILNDVLRSLTGADAIEAKVTRLVMDHFGADRCYYCEVEEGNAVVRQDAARGDLPSVAGTYPLSSFAIFKKVVDNGKPFIVHDSNTTDILDEPLRVLCLQLQVISFIDVPVIKNGVAVGIFCIVQSTPRRWRDEEVDLAVETAERIWAAVKRARAEEALRISEAALRKNEQQLIALLKQKDEFIGVASHELKTPVTSMKAYAEIVREMLGEAGLSLESDILKRLSAQIDRLTLLINDLLDTTKISEGKLNFRFEPSDINELLRERIEEIRTTTSRKLDMHLAQLPLVNADKDRIGQVIVNLLTNAIKYSPEGSTITINTTSFANGIQVSVQDEGYGITEEEQLKIFDRFYRVTANYLDTYPGMGLGLFISKQIIERHGGTIEVKSTPGKGSVFFFTLPLVKDGVF